jgi:cytochrome c-type biogenesis protein
MTLSYSAAAAAALWLGVMTSISPCPLATNIVAVSYVGSRIGNPRYVVLAGMLYAAGRAIAYSAVAWIVSASLLSIPEVSFFLQKNGGRAIGPLLIVAGVLLLGFIKLPALGGGVSGGFQKRVERFGVWGAAMLGFIFALSFCPVSAALFFGSLIPLTVKFRAGFTLPVIYGAGTAIPVVVFSILIARGTQAVGKSFDSLSRFELWARRATAIVFLSVGAYYVKIFFFTGG